MSNGRTPVQAIRPIAGPVMLAVFVLAAQLAPVGHLVTHRNDHTHGPALAPLGDAAHEAAHRAGRAHDHAPSDDGLTAEERAWLEGNDAPPSHSHDGAPGHDHGRDSVAHFGIALLEGPPPPIVPPPAEAAAPPADEVLRGHDAPLLPQPPSRGPPA